jgi:hypothetical protein
MGVYLPSVQVHSGTSLMSSARSTGSRSGAGFMHAWTLEGEAGWEDEDEFKKLVSPESLTLACLGIAHADAQIAPKIGGRLGAAARGRK